MVHLLAQPPIHRLCNRRAVYRALRGKLDCLPASFAERDLRIGAERGDRQLATLAAPELPGPADLAPRARANANVEALYVVCDKSLGLAGEGLQRTKPCVVQCHCVSLSPIIWVKFG